MRDLILGTAGHIDHGKTSLIGALTGTNTDRLPEEKKRGITIELGYAFLEIGDYRIGVVDVPGHEKFVRQMLAGATGMDMVLLVIAGDDSVKQQTIEHLDILRLLDLTCGVIALTKCDLCEDSWLELVEDEIRSTVADTFLHDAPIIRTSSKTGMGIDELKQALGDAAGKVAATEVANLESAPFRMAIDRAFSIEGHGTVVTGSVSSGKLSMGDSVEVQPGSIPVRVRGIQNHDSGSEEVHRGQRAAINLGGVKLDEFGRGHELAAVGHLVPSSLLTVRIHLLSSVRKPLKDRTRVRFHVGTAELFGNVRLLGCSEIDPGKSGIAQIWLSEPAVTVWNQPFVIRLESPVMTIGGGRVLHPEAAAIKKATAADLKHVNRMDSESPDERAASAVYLLNDASFDPASFPRVAGAIDFLATYDRLKESGELVETAISQTRSVCMHRDRFELLGAQVVKTLTRLHEANPLRFNHKRNVVENEFAWLKQKELLDAVIEHLKKEKTVFANVQSVSLAGFGPKLSKGQKALLEELLKQLRAAELKPPTAAELQKSATKNKESVPELLEMAAENGDIIKVNSEYYFHAEVFDSAQEKIREAIETGGGMTMSDIRTLIDTSRKWAVPLCEYFDESGFTRREGDLRVLA
ncbi:selenocysteine-specific translation elongation factor [Mariniblastus fucicola]|uniref:Selenocysteine-specific elongation factor n=1 Tax=Mariniblastus fucicola TaxID=980251 RepID=A0A5B9PCC3_9BACT|nr:selenocysteine-specific translation elongation factor [Mariniblastus fucicola]QEG23139.1 Selenocysteine-specific elongation factor [Mariniblastus fucicola]